MPNSKSCKFSIIFGGKRKTKREQIESASNLKDVTVITDGTMIAEIVASEVACDTPVVEKVRAVSRKSIRLSRDLKLAIVIDICLWINGVSYEHGTMCTFCTLEKATINCPQCADFFCEACDYRNHDVKKRSGHRSKLSFLSAMFCADFRYTS